MIEQDSRDLAGVVRDKLTSGSLPRETPTKMWVGHGNDRPCDVCERPITPTDIEYEPDFADPAIHPRFHQQCLALWHEERARTT